MNLPHDAQPTDPLDGLLAQARWDAPSAARLSRLQSTWRTALAARRARRWMAISGLAAALLLTAGVGLWQWRSLRDPANQTLQTTADVHGEVPTDLRRPIASHTDAPDQPATVVLLPGDPAPPRTPDPTPEDRPTPGSPPVPEPNPPATANAPPVWRAPNTYERLVLAGVERRRPVPPPEEPVVTPVDAALARLTETGDASSLLKLTGRDALAELRLAFQDKAARSAAAHGLALFEESTALAALIHDEADAAVRDTLLAGLVERNDDAAVAAVLELIVRPGHAEAALTALAAARQPPVDRYFGVLTGPLTERRALAARALGQFDSPIVTRRLIDLVVQGAYQQDALLALVASDGPEAERFVSLARRDELLMSSIAWAERRFLVLFPQQQQRMIP